MEEKLIKEIKGKDDTTRDRFLEEPLGRLIPRNILPSIAAMVMIGLYGIVDGILIGRSLGPGPMASINLLFPILALAIGLATMVGVGGNTRIGILLGRGDISRAKGVFTVTVILGLLVGLVTSLAIFLGFDLILSFLGKDLELGQYAGEYLKGYYMFFPPIIIFFIMERSVRNDGRPNFATGVMIFTSILNIILDYIFLFPLKLGLWGAAMATGISQTIGASIFLLYFLFKLFKKEEGLTFGSSLGCWNEVLGIVGNGSSELFNGIAIGITTIFYNRQIIQYAGSAGLAAFVLVQYFLILASQILLGMATGAQPIFSYNYGAGRKDRVEKTLKITMSIGLIISLIFFILLRWQAYGLVGLFITEEKDTAGLAIEVAGYISWSFLFMAIGILGSAYFTAIEEIGKSLIVAILRGLVLIIIGLTIFPILWGQGEYGLQVYLQRVLQVFWSYFY